MFAEVAPGAHFATSKDPRRRARPTRIDSRHVLASSAIPLIFPAREIDGRYFSDGSIRNTAPLRPAINLGADRIIAIGVSGPPPAHVEAIVASLMACGRVTEARLLAAEAITRSA
jgi:predicted acylesterase/phospholipase RssA